MEAIQTVISKSEPVQIAAMTPMGELAGSGAVLAFVTALILFGFLLLSVANAALAIRRTAGATSFRSVTFRLLASIFAFGTIVSLALSIAFASVASKVEQVGSSATEAYPWKIDRAYDLVGEAAGMSMADVQNRLGAYLTPVAEDDATYDLAAVSDNAAYAVERGVAYAFNMTSFVALLVLGPLLSYLVCANALDRTGPIVALASIVALTATAVHLGPRIASGVVDVEAVPQVTEKVDRFTKAAVILGPAFREASDATIDSMDLVLYKPNISIADFRQADPQGNTTVEIATQFVGTRLVRPFVQLLQ